MKKCKHLFRPAFTDKVNGNATIIIICEKCGEMKKYVEMIGDNNVAH